MSAKAGKPIEGRRTKHVLFASSSCPIPKTFCSLDGEAKNRFVAPALSAGRTLRTDSRSECWMKLTASQVTSPSLSEYVWMQESHSCPCCMLDLRVIYFFVGVCGAGHQASCSAIRCANRKCGRHCQMQPSGTKLRNRKMLPYLMEK